MLIVLNNKPKIMKTKLLILATMMLGLVLACSKDDGTTSPLPEPEIQKSSEKQVTGFSFVAIDNATLETAVVATIDQQAKTITANFPFGTSVNALAFEVSHSTKARVAPRLYRIGDLYGHCRRWQHGYLPGNSEY